MRLALASLVLVVSALAQDEGSQSLPEAKAAFAKVDAALNASYAEAKRALPDYKFEALRKDQREWIEYRDARALEGVQFEFRQTPEGKEKETAAYWEWLKELTGTRLEILRGWRGVGPADSLSGRYMDGRGGVLELVEKDQQLFFTLQVVRGPTYHLGDIHGVAKLNQSMARFSDAEVAEAGKLKAEGETWLTFIEEEPWLKIIGTNTSHYHGARAYFDGQYIRVATLDEKEAATVQKQATDPGWSSQEDGE